MIKFLKSLFSKHSEDKFPTPETPKPKVIPYGQGTSSGWSGYKIDPTTPNWPGPPPIISGTNSYSYSSENVIKITKEETINDLKRIYPDSNDERIQLLYDALTSDYWSEPKKKLPKRDSKGRFSK